MKIKRQSPMTGKWHEADLPITEEEVCAYIEGELIQYAFPNANDEQREFIKTGYTPEDWARMWRKKIPASAKDYVQCDAPPVKKDTIHGWEK